MVRRYVPRLEVLEERMMLKAPDEAPSLGPPPPEGPNAIYVDTVAELENAVANLQSGQTIVIQPGTYNLNNTLWINPSNSISNVTIRGATDDFNDVVLVGKGMENAGYGGVPHGIWVGDVQNLTIANLTIGEVYFHPIQLSGNSGADSIHIYHVRLYDAGEQFVKANGTTSPGDGVDDSSVKYSVIEYTSGPPVTDHGGGTGYTNGIDVHTGDNWVIQHNLIRNFHVADGLDNLWNPAILMWNDARNTLVEGNTIVDTDRAIAFGLYDATPNNHTGGIIRNNFIYMSPDLFSPSRDASGDAPVIVWDSPNTKVYHNTIITNGNHYFAVEYRFDGSGEIYNNLTDQGFRHRDNNALITTSGNYTSATAGMFVDAATANLHLASNAATQANVIDQAAAISGSQVIDDFDGDPRATSGQVDIGADEYQSATSPEIDVQGNGNSIADGDTTPSPADHTDFGSTDIDTGAVVRVFSIENTGNANLTISNVNITGSGDFIVTQAPAGSVAPGNTTTFQVSFNPSATGEQTATVSIASSDSDENPYTFAIRGNGTNRMSRGSYAMWSRPAGQFDRSGGGVQAQSVTVFLSAQSEPEDMASAAFAASVADLKPAEQDEFVRVETGARYQRRIVSQVINEARTLPIFVNHDQENETILRRSPDQTFITELDALFTTGSWAD